MAKWQNKVEKEIEKTSTNYRKGKELLLPIFKKYNFDLSTTKEINTSKWLKSEKENFIKGMKYIGYNEEICHRLYKGIA